MTPEQIRELAQAIANEQIAAQWLFYGVWLLLTICAAGIGSWFGAYFRKRGEHYATRADFKELIDQLKKTTEAAEGVRTEIAHTDWATKEWKTLRRIKAEEFLAEAEKAKQAFVSQSEDYLFSEVKVYGELGARVHMLALLYFPEALIPTIHFAALLTQGKSLLLDIWQEMNKEGVALRFSGVRTRRLHEVAEHTAKFEEPLNQMQQIVRTCLWQALGLPEYEHDPEDVAAVLALMPTAPPSRKP